MVEWTGSAYRGSVSGGESQERRLGGFVIADPTRKIRPSHKVTAYLLAGHHSFRLKCE